MNQWISWTDVSLLVMVLAAFAIAMRRSMRAQAKMRQVPTSNRLSGRDMYLAYCASCRAAKKKATAAVPMKTNPPTTNGPAQATSHPNTTKSSIV